MNVIETILSYMKVVGTAVTGLQGYLHFLPFLPTWIAPTLAAVAIVVDDIPPIVTQIVALFAPSPVPPASTNGSASTASK